MYRVQVMLRTTGVVENYGLEQDIFVIRRKVGRKYDNRKFENVLFFKAYNFDVQLHSINFVSLQEAVQGHVTRYMTKNQIFKDPYLQETLAIMAQIA